MCLRAVTESVRLCICLALRFLAHCSPSCQASRRQPAQQQQQQQHTGSRDSEYTQAAVLHFRQRSERNRAPCFATLETGEVYQLTDSTVTVALDRAIDETALLRLTGGRQQLVQVPNSVTYARTVAASTFLFLTRGSR